LLERVAKLGRDRDSGRARIVENFSAAIMVDRTLDLLHEVNLDH
jgi:hypothetical protein